MTLSVKVTGAEDKPRIAEEQSFITLGSGEKDTVVGSVNVYDGSQYAGFVLASASSSNDNDKFIRTDSGDLKVMQKQQLILANKINMLLNYMHKITMQKVSRY